MTRDHATLLERAACCGLVILIVVLWLVLEHPDDADVEW